MSEYCRLVCDDEWRAITRKLARKIYLFFHELKLHFACILYTRRDLSKTNRYSCSVRWRIRVADYATK